MCKGPVAKLLIGVLLIVAGVFAIIPEWIAQITVWQITSGFAWEAFKTVILGAIPPMLIFLGILMVWIEIEEIKIERMEREIEEERKTKRTRRKK